MVKTIQFMTGIIAIYIMKNICAYSALRDIEK